jgi:ABC-2 type transport system ATP-binding protein
LFTVLSDEDNAGRHTAVTTIGDGVSSNDVLAAILSSGVTVNSFKELIPRMNDIFIKLVTQEEEA